MVTNYRKVEAERVHPHPIIIVEGIFVLILPEIQEYLDFKVYVDVPDDLRLELRIVRDARDYLMRRWKGEEYKGEQLRNSDGPAT